jgi:tetratricopeptide (TPR) repeat protein
MAPEQKAALDAVLEGKPVPAAVDGRADLYALGLMLYQALGGTISSTNPLPRLDRVNPAVSTGLADILHRCLLPDANERYARAGDLADDLHRHLNDQPLRGVQNRSWKERWSKWRRRRPQALALYGLFASLAVLVAGGGYVYHSSRQQEEAARLARIEQAWSAGQKEMRERRYGDAIASFEQALAVVQDTPQAGAWLDKLRQELEAARRGQLVDSLHDAADLVRFAGGSLAPTALWSDLEPSFERIWEERHKVLEVAHTGPDKERRQIQTDFLDLALVAIHLRSTAGMDNGRHREALDMLAEAEKLFGASPVLLQEKVFHARAAGDKTLARAAENALHLTPPKTPWDYYALGRSLLQTGALDQAARHLDQAVALAPDAFWPNFYQGVCAFRQGKFAGAVEAFRAALVAQPRSGPIYFNRGLAYAAMTLDDKAVYDFTKALELDPHLAAAAALQRGLMHARAGRHPLALADFAAALKAGADAAETHYQTALVHWDRKDRKAALDSVQQSLRQRPHFAQAQALAEMLKMGSK